MIKLSKLLLTLVCVIFPALANANGCDEYEAEALAISGVVPRFNDDGSLRSILLHGEATFLTNKRSLINAARTKAELSAKQALSSFLNESVSAAQKATSLLEQAEITDQDGNTEGKALELATVVEGMQSNTSAVMKGIVKLDECVDVDEKYVLVTLGWKPETKRSASTPSSKVNDSQNLNNGSAQADNRSDQASVGSDGGCVNSVKIETVATTGYGRNQNEAISDGIRIAVSQVFGEVFASSIELTSASVSVEVTDQDGNTQGRVAEGASQTQASASKTAGVIKSYRIVGSERSGQSYEVSLVVEMPTYCNLDLDMSKKKTVVLTPSVIADRDWTRFGDKLAGSIKLELESLLNETIELTVLTRSDDNEIAQELSSINIEEYSISELAKKGNKLAADYIVITEFSDFETSRKAVKVGPRKRVDMYITSAQAWVRVVDVVTSNLVASIRVPLTSRSVDKDNNVEAFSITMAHNMASVIGERVGGGFNDFGKSLLATSANKISNYTEAKERLNKARQKLESEVKDDW